MIKQAISDICISMKAADYLTLPDMLVNNVPVALDAAAAKAYAQLETELLLQVDEDTITAGSAGVLTGKLLQLCNGAIYNENKTAVKVHDCKIDAFLELIEQLHGNTPLCSTTSSTTGTGWSRLWQNTTCASGFILKRKTSRIGTTEKSTSCLRTPRAAATA